MDRYWIYIALIGAAVGSSFYFNEVLLRDMGPFWIAEGRLVFGAVASWVLLLALRRRWRLPKRSTGVLVFLAVVMYVFPFVCYPVGQQYAPSGVAAIVNAFAPVFSVLIGHFWPGRPRLTGAMMLAVLAGVAGIVVLMSPAIAHSQTELLFGSLILLGGPLGFALSAQVAASIQESDPAVNLTWSLTIGAALMLPIAALSEPFPAQIALKTVLNLLVLGVGLTAIVFYVIFAIVKKTGPTRIVTATFIAPVSAVILGSFILRESLAPAHYLGLVIIFFALVLVGRAQKLATAAVKDKPDG